MNDKVLNLLLITKGEKQHYVLIKDFNTPNANMADLTVGPGLAARKRG